MKERRVLTLLFVALLLAVRMVTVTGRSAQPVVAVYDIQYTADPGGDSPYAGQTVTTRGVVSLVSSSGYVIQDRVRVDGLALLRQPATLKRFFDPASVVDPVRPALTG